MDVVLDTSELKVVGIPLDVLGGVLDALLNGLIAVLGDVLGLVSSVLTPVLDLLDGALLGPLLKTLGIQIGYADVQLLSASCDGNARLVY
ncbi:hypothetical protein D3C86_1930550 [compost metagenome]